MSTVNNPKVTNRNTVSHSISLTNQFPVCAFGRYWLRSAAPWFPGLGGSPPSRPQAAHQWETWRDKLVRLADLTSVTSGFQLTGIEKIPRYFPDFSLTITQFSLTIQDKTLQNKAPIYPRKSISLRGFFVGSFGNDVTFTNKESSSPS